VLDIIAGEGWGALTVGSLELQGAGRVKDLKVVLLLPRSFMYTLYFASFAMIGVLLRGWRFIACFGKAGLKATPVDMKETIRGSESSYVRWVGGILGTRFLYSMAPSESLLRVRLTVNALKEDGGKWHKAVFPLS
jgi:hypothetical protein